ncbi:hypothetical protein [Ewingella americana]|uniref:hypothetical protein n=1 Tax=Ewingella americana TaxID=41202 RepID=UPI0012AD9608|nr:hypothetical protein [Ewingella americana]MRT01927.1 hypothetical protein [Ewingella americana]
MNDKTDIEALRDSAECMANLLDNLAGYEPQDIDMDTVEIRFEDGNGFDTGCDISVVDTAQKSADIIRSLLDQLEAERQQREAAEAELAELRGEQEPVGFTNDKGLEALSKGYMVTITPDDRLLSPAPLFTRQPKPVVVLSFEQWCKHRGEKPLGWVREAMKDAYDGALESAGIAVKDGE